MTPVSPPHGDVQDRWPLWNELQRNAVVAYDADPQAHLSVGRRRDATLFSDFSELAGLVLDVGCGPQSVPSYGVDFIGRLVGIDPLVGVQPREFDFVQGLGEYLPFPDATFDRVLFATSLDHMLVPTLALREARRVVKRTGMVSMWVHSHHDNSHESMSQLRRKGRAAVSILRHRGCGGLAQVVADRLRPARTRHRDHLSTLAIPAGAQDPFHAYHLREETVGAWAEEVGLRKLRVVTDRDRGSFLLLAPTP